MSQGFTTTVAAPGMLAPLHVSAKDNGDLPIRSITIGNQTSATTAVIFGSSLPAGTALYAIIPGQFATLPIQETPNVTVVFVAQLGQKFDGAVYVHADPTPLTASGFLIPTTAPLWVWDSSSWDGGAVWSG